MNTPPFALESVLANTTEQLLPHAMTWGQMTGYFMFCDMNPFRALFVAKLKLIDLPPKTEALFLVCSSEISSKLWSRICFTILFIYYSIAFLNLLRERQID